MLNSTIFFFDFKKKNIIINNLVFYFKEILCVHFEKNQSTINLWNIKNFSKT